MEDEEWTATPGTVRGPSGDAHTVWNDGDGSRA